VIEVRARPLRQVPGQLLHRRVLTRVWFPSLAKEGLGVVRSKSSQILQQSIRKIDRTTPCPSFAKGSNILTSEREGECHRRDAEDAERRSVSLRPLRLRGDILPLLSEVC